MIKTINVNIKPYSYNIYLGNNLNLNTYLTPFKENKIFIITDNIVYKLYLEYIKKQFNNYNYEVIIIKSGEKSKSIKTYEKVINKLLYKKIKRTDLIISFGGGVVGDLAGFISATLFRGIKLVNIPTTLLSMVDSSIGGKTAIDHYYGKNLIGSFKQPELVLIDVNFLNTLKEYDFNNGMAEVIKVGLIKDKTLIKLLQNESYNIVDIIYKAINVKKEIVEADPYENKLRMILNFGHSFAHAIEVNKKYKLKHGYAVSMGMDISLQIGILLKETNKEVLPIFYELLNKFSLPKFSLNINNLFKYLDYDKKSTDDYINFIILKDIEEVEIKQIKKETLYELTHKKI